MARVLGAVVLVAGVSVTAAGPAAAADPVYTDFGCKSYYSDEPAPVYMNLNVSDSSRVCPWRGMFFGRNGYMPVSGFQASIYDDFGYVSVYEHGSCSDPLDDTGGTWDFQVPCRAHDYCYDLRKAGFSNTVTDEDCDLWFKHLMNADCNNRSGLAQADCNFVKEGAYNAVRQWFVVTDPDPGLVEIRSNHNGKCADVEGAGNYDGAALQQWDCVGQAQQRFRIWPGSQPGWFYIKASHSGRCADTDTLTAFPKRLSTWGCAAVSQREFHFVASYSAVTTIVSRRHMGCWDIPYGSSTNGQDLVEWHCDGTTKQNWKLHAP